jgi:hypothetical protein
MIPQKPFSVRTEDLKIFLENLRAFGGSLKEPYLCDSAQTLLDYLFGEEPIMDAFTKFTENNIKFM